MALVTTNSSQGFGMPGIDKAMEIHLRLLAERASEALSHDQAADYLIGLIECIDPALTRQLLAEDAQRMAKETAHAPGSESGNA